MKKHKLAHLAISFFTAGALLWGCAGKKEPLKTSAVMDDPDHHYFSGMTLVDKGELDQAREEFLRGQELDPTYSPAYAGEALVSALQGNFAQAHKLGEKACALASKNRDQEIARVAMIRIYTLEKGDGWLKNCKAAFAKAIKANPNSAPAYFYMGEAAKLAFEFKTAEKMYTRVLELNNGMVMQADQGLKLVQKIQRAAPGTRIGKQIALQDKISRADVAALFVEELKLEQLLTKALARTTSSEFQTPSEFEEKAAAGEKTELPADMVDHPLRTDVETVLGLDIRGLEVTDDKFYPDEPIAKADYALMVEDIISKLSRDESLSSKFIGSASPYPDVKPDHYAFNAIMVCTSRDIIDPEPDGNFGLEKPVSGADALLIIRKLKEDQKIF